MPQASFVEIPLDENGPLPEPKTFWNFGAIEPRALSAGDYARSVDELEEALIAAFEHRGQLAAEEFRRNQEELETQYAVEEKLKRKENEMLDLYSEGESCMGSVILSEAKDLN